MTIKDLLLNYKVIVCVGTGGVGKTTHSSSLAYLASQQGKKVLVLTVDPAKRLAHALGVDSLTNTVRSVLKQKNGGELFACVVDSKVTFDEFIKSHSSSQEMVNKILNNKIYHKLSTQLSGSQEFTSLEKLYSAYEENAYDLIILDTPPTGHALDFLAGAQKYETLFHDSIVKWFARPFEKNSFFTQILNRGTNLAFGVLETLTGTEFLKEMMHFFNEIYMLKDILTKRMENVRKLLTSSDATFILITGFDATKLKESKHFLVEMRKRQYSISNILVNRSIPSISEKELKVLEQSEELNLISNIYKDFSMYSKEIEAALKELKSEVKDKTSKDIGRAIHTFFVPDFDQDICDLQGLDRVAKVLSELESK